MDYSDEFNKVYISGEIVSEATFSHETYNENFYECMVKVERLSGNFDILPVIVSERIISQDWVVGKQVNILGQFRSYNRIVDGKSRLELYVFVRELLDEPINNKSNIVELVGCLCKPPVYRTTPFNREIADLLIAVNRSYNKSDYIPAIAWGRNARFVRSLSVGDKVALSGRIQSREYQKKQPDESFVTMTAYEVSISKLAAFDDESEFDIDEEFDLYSAPHTLERNEQ